MSENKYETACFVCGRDFSLQMFAHRNPQGGVVGWLFVCVGDEYKVRGADFKMSVSQPGFATSYPTRKVDGGTKNEVFRAIGVRVRALWSRLLQAGRGRRG